ncbi:aldose 1-epimerase family protein [Petralouisia muris]|uniref:Aldose 1-epimerase family protein n=1 Tax=Petralouisia muris TaxID=3032872 RepID=A0AC61RRZ2_9FIRM|nr:aldose 1-epimerase family protein [Petralouisia muris]TGY91942.1 aldose 1-epimerase family protein [Petralouisia muris]
MVYELKNEKLTVQFSNLGAEMVSLKNNKTGQEYLWQGDSRYWGRRSPVLFPVVGRLINDRYVYDNKEYPMSQHGFARDMEFACISESREEITFGLDATPVTKENYPFDFRLEIGYRLKEDTVTVTWKVINLEREREMYFSIGGHPGFLCPLKEGESQSEYSIWMDQEEVLFSRIDLETGLMRSYKNVLTLPQGRRVLEEGVFDEGVYIMEDYQVQKVSLLNPDNEPYLTVSFQTPLVGIWSPEKKHAPFVCIEPWYGRCDREAFQGNLRNREWGNMLVPGGVFERSYQITVEQ